MAEDAADEAHPERRLGALLRLLARWRQRSAAEAPETGDEAPLPVPLTGRPPDAIAIRQWLWGPGFVIPGNAEHVRGLVLPFGLSPATTLLDVSAGLGGPIRAIAAHFSTYANGLERDPEIARQGMAMSNAAGFARRAPIAVYDPESFDLPLGHYDFVLGREATYAVRDKERFLRAVVQGLKPQGALVLAEFVLDRSRGDRRQLDGWAPLAQYPPYLWTLERYVDCLKSLGSDVRITEEMNAAYRATIIAGWTGLIRRTDLGRLPHEHIPPIIAEAERSLATVQALDEGVLRLYRIFALARRG